MDGMNWFSDAEVNEAKREERAAFRTAMIGTLVAVAVGIGVVLALSVSGLLPATADIESPSIQAMGGP